MALDHHFDEPTAIRTNLDAIFVSLELSRSTWLITSVSPGGGEKMSKRGVSAGNVAALLTRLSELKQKAFARTGKSFHVVAIQGIVRVNSILPACAPGRGRASLF